MKIVPDVFKKIIYIKQLVGQGILKPSDINTIYNHLMTKNN